LSVTRLFKVIIFDVDNTLIYRLPRPVETLLSFARERGLTPHLDALRRGERRNYVYYAGGQADEERALLGAAGFEHNYVQALLEAMCATKEISPWVEEAVKCLQETPRQEFCPEEHRQVVRQLSQAGYHLVALSNRDGDLRPALAAHRLDPFFNFALSGGRAGVYKPNPEIFRIVLKTLGVAAGATLSIGDSYDADIAGAEQLGITGVLLDPLGIYPEARCRVINRLEELLPWLILA
jgi:HAD superfamily hydrolase (TIGR01549 family)